MMLNNYIAPIELNVSDYHLFTPIEEYNFNFIWKKIPNSLISFGGVKLIPLVVTSFLLSSCMSYTC